MGGGATGASLDGYEDLALVDGVATALPAGCTAGPDGLVLAAAGERRIHLRALAGGGESGWSLRLGLARAAQVRLVIVHAQTAPARQRWRLDADLADGAILEVEELLPPGIDSVLGEAGLRLGRDARVRWTAASAGGRELRLRWDAVLAAPGAEADYASLDVVAGAGQAHRATCVEHAAGPTTSRQLVKAVLRDRAITSFDGLVRVLPGADGTDADQQNRNLVLSPTARADTRPQLDIRADEVKAAHGATVGRLDEDELLYLRLRGLPAAAATALAMTGFTGEVLERFAAPTRAAYSLGIP